MTPNPRNVIVVGGGPAGLMAAERIALAGHRVELFDAMPSVGRKFLLAGIGGLNLTHSEPAPKFVARYGEAAAWMSGLLDRFGAEALRQWAGELGIDTFVGSSGRVFPVEMKAAPLLRAWLQRLRAAQVRIHPRHRWTGWVSPHGKATTDLRLVSPSGALTRSADAVVLALGGGSWSRLGSDGAWMPWLADRGIALAPLRPANCGFDICSPSGDGIGWGDYFANRFAGQALKNIAIRIKDADGDRHERVGECLVTVAGLEGSLIYALAAPIRDAIEAAGSPLEIRLDLFPGRPLAALTEALSQPRGRRSLSNHLHSKAGISGVKAGLLREFVPPEEMNDMRTLAAKIKSLPLRLARPRPIDEAISTAGGVALDELDHRMMVKRWPGLFCCGEMLDWEAPTGGYLLTGCFATGHAAGDGVVDWLAR